MVLILKSLNFYFYSELRRSIYKTDINPEVATSLSLIATQHSNLGRYEKSLALQSLVLDTYTFFESSKKDINLYKQNYPELK